MSHKRTAASVIAMALSLSGLLLLPASSPAQPFNFVSIDVPCSACPGGIARRTAIGGISPTGDIVGVYTDAVGMQHGFLLSGGQFTTIDVPNAVSTTARGISPNGDIVGQYTAPVSSAPWGSPAYCPAAGSTACIEGFLYSHGGFSTVLLPGHPGAIPGRITPDGSMYGCYHDFDVMGSMFSAAWTRFGDTSIAAGGGELTDTTMSFPNSMHGGASPSGNVMVGFYVDMTTGHQHGYIIRNGMLQSYDVPNSILTTIGTSIPKRNSSALTRTTQENNTGFCNSRTDLRRSPLTIRTPSLLLLWA